MTEEDLLFNFIEGLQNWAKQELQRRGVKDIDEAIAVAESLMEYARVGDSSKGKNAQVASKGNHAKGGGDKPKAWHKGNNQASMSKSKDHGKLEERRAKNKPKDGCFFCGGPHWARDCPRQGKLNALVEENEESENQAVPTGEGQASTNKGLLYVEAKFNGKPTKVMVDTGATHNFVTMEEAKRLGLKVVGSGGWLKSVNTNAKPLQGAARQVEMSIGSWRGLVDFSVAPMDDFKVVIGLDFLRQVNALVSPYSNAVHIMEKGALCVVPMSGGLLAPRPNRPCSCRRCKFYFQSQKKLSSKQARWQDFLAEFDYVMEYKPGKANLVADALSRKAELVAMSKVKGDILEGIKEGMEHDPLAKELLKLAESGQTQQF
ncbi:hypothetical protein RJ640_010541 [Escallonia rubra]|uniref:Uncharacterized protein n=1 Tax=Escallonia rubra TaxID=112253 RepID=A0AA88QU35_9ASTE|nr:hypothetical protein RJ640_010541 [Escallonia rubra]